MLKNEEAKGKLKKIDLSTLLIIMMGSALVTIQIALIVLKCCGIITSHWLVVLIPTFIIILVIISLVLYFFYLIYKISTVMAKRMNLDSDR